MTATFDPQLSEMLALIRAERAAPVRNWTRYRNLRFMLANIRAELRFSLRAPWYC